jgi:hypothetical protein
VIVVRRLINEEGFPSGVAVDVRGPRLQKVLLDLNKDTKGFGFQKDPPEVTVSEDNFVALILTSVM